MAIMVSMSGLDLSFMHEDKPKPKKRPRKKKGR